jgi:PrtD family type I secretion system ABC transporter
MKTVERVAADFRSTLWMLAGFSAFLNLLLLAQPIYMLQVYDRILPSQSVNTLLFLSLAVGLALVVLGLLEVVRTLIANRAAARFDVSLSDLAIKTVIRNGTAAGGSTQPLRDIAAMRGLITSKALFALLDLPFAVLFILILYFIHPALFWVTVAGTVVLLLIALLNQQALSALAKKQGEMSVSAGVTADHLARSADSVVAMGMVGNVVREWGRAHAGSLVAADRAGSVNAWFAGLSKILRLALQIVILGYGALLVLEGEMTAGMIFASSIISGRALQPIDQLIGSWRQLASGQEAWSRLKLFLDKADRQSKYTSLPEPTGLLEAQDLFLPNAIDPSRPPVLSRVSFRLEPGEAVAVLGPSGSGKSTLARMLVGASLPRSGHVRIDGHDITNWDPEELGHHIGYLAQDVELVPGTIAQNISRFDADAKDPDIIAAARAAHAQDLIQKLPRGYDTLIGPGALQLSGGEKQRIALARAFYGSPKILVLDEPNSNLDRIGEVALMQALADARTRKVTFFVITQRETMLASVDKIMRFQNGSVTEFDDRDTVLARHRKGASNVAQLPVKPQAQSQTTGQST